MNRNIALGVVLVLVVLAGVYMFMAKKEVTTEMAQSTPTPAVTATPTQTTTTSTDSGTMANVKTFTVTGTPFKYDVPEIKVNKGDTVKIVYKNAQGTHDWVVDEFKARTKVLNVGQEETVQFVADKAGTFEYYCSVGNHRQMGMKGNLIVQ